MEKHLAFVLGGGAARGALQVGALRALLEAGIQPDLLVGTSAGALNATYLALRGVSLSSIEAMADAWREAAAADLLPSSYLWLTVRALLDRTGGPARERIREFLIRQGLTPDLRFGDIPGARLIVVAADLNTGRPVLYGQDPQQSVLEGVLASTALPPWVYPIEKDGRLLMDGGAISNLPVEPALSLGATEIIALDLADPRDVPVAERGLGPLLIKLMSMAEGRQTELELALAEARGVPVRRIALRGEPPVALWDFHRTDEMIARGYEIARQEIAPRQPERPAGWRGWLSKLMPARRPKT